MNGWMIFLAVCCTIGASNSNTALMTVVWLVAAIAFGMTGVLA